jgi:hypothetical protein
MSILSKKLCGWILLFVCMSPVLYGITTFSNEVRVKIGIVTLIFIGGCVLFGLIFWACLLIESDK